MRWGEKVGGGLPSELMRLGGEKVGMGGEELMRWGGGGLGISFFAWKGISAECTLFYGVVFFWFFFKQKAITSNHLCFDHFLFSSPNPGSQGFPSP